MTPEDKAGLDYEQGMEVFTLLTDVRFKLLALVPTISGTAVALLSSADIGKADQVVLASLGFVVTLGILFYEKRNTQLYNNARPAEIERAPGPTELLDDDVLARSGAAPPYRLATPVALSWV